MSAPTPANGDSSPSHGFYPDPSIPGYVRYWNGSAWVPGTSRPAPAPGEPMPLPPPGAAPAVSYAANSGLPNLASVPAPAPGPTRFPAATPAAVEETGPFFFDEEEQPGEWEQHSGEPVSGERAGNEREGYLPAGGELEVRRSAEPAPAWQADTSRQSGFGGERDRRVSWGSPNDSAASPVPARPVDGTPSSGHAGPSGQAGHAGPPGAPAATPPGLTPAPAHGRAPSRDPRTAGPSGPSGNSAALPPRAERPALEARPEQQPHTRQPHPQDPQSSQSHQPHQPQQFPQQQGEQPRSPSRADRTVSIRTPRPAEGSVADGTMAIRTVKPPSQQTGSQQPGSQQPGSPQPGSPQTTPPQPRTSQAPAQPAAQQRSPHHQQALQQQAPHQQPPQQRARPAQQSRAQAQEPARPSQPQGGQPAAAVPASWAQQVHELAAPAAQGQAAGQSAGRTPGKGPASGQDEAPPVVPWKPPVEDHFTKAAREQAAARPAGLGRRLVARLIDTAVLGAAVAAVAVPLVLRALDHIDEKIRAARLSGTTVTVYLLDATTVGILAAVVGAFLVLGVLYEAVPTAKWGRTLGKKVCGLQVRDIEEHEPPRFGGALRRWLVYGVLGVLGVGVLGVLWCLVDRPWRQCWHDKAGRTFVAKG
ncbi:RDD family protein [Streptomyces sp. NPDC058657]|uniref:RDD family protein n=1 Tax=unclassified Streptomyces TaxID=2593676 RepID=UPI00364C5154